MSAHQGTYLVVGGTDLRPVPRLIAPGRAHVDLTDADTPEATVLALARAGYVLAGPGHVPTLPGEASRVVALSPAATACPPWCTRCATGPALALDVATGRAFLEHRGLVGSTGPGGTGWRVELRRHVLLGDPPTVGRTGTHVHTSTDRTAMTLEESRQVADLLALAATEPLPWTARGTEAAR